MDREHTFTSVQTGEKFKVFRRRDLHVCSVQTQGTETLSLVLVSVDNYEAYLFLILSWMQNIKAVFSWSPLGCFHFTLSNFFGGSFSKDSSKILTFCSCLGLVKKDPETLLLNPPLYGPLL